MDESCLTVLLVVGFASLLATAICAFVAVTFYPTILKYCMPPLLIGGIAWIIAGYPIMSLYNAAVFGKCLMTAGTLMVVISLLLLPLIGQQKHSKPLWYTGD